MPAGRSRRERSCRLPGQALNAWPCFGSPGPDASCGPKLRATWATRSSLLEVADGFAGASGDEAGEGADRDVGGDEADGAVAHAVVGAGGVEGVDLAVVGAIDGQAAGARIVGRIA